jgi:hypothetical protein
MDFAAAQLLRLLTFLVLSSIHPSLLTTISRRRTSTTSVHPHQSHEAEYDYPPNYHPDSHRLQVPGQTPLAPTSPSLTALPSPAPSSHTTTSTSAQGLFTPQQCQWKNCSSSTIFQREGDLVRHLKTIHISPNAFPCPEPDCTRAFGRNDHLKNHLKTMHRF